MIKDGTAYIQAGAGIVADSVPQLEYEETQHKAAAVVRAGTAASGMRAPHAASNMRAPHAASRVLA